MKFRIIALVVIIVACHKDNFQTKPTIEVKSLNTKEVTPGGQLDITLKFTDKEGDIGDGQLTYIRIRTNNTTIPDPTNNDKADTVRYTIPTFPDHNKGEIVVNISYNFMDEDPVKNDTMFFKIAVRDKKNNISDTISTESVVAK
ncbi:MAG: hypothetical protein M3O67_01940 [Bacteroidota bacterium]|nr:hypothetical protein [Bacteroidota bacterium]